MEIDYVNKQLVCPTCGEREFIYIDLNDIRLDQKSGVVVRSLLHRDHIVILDIDQQGDIRASKPLEPHQQVDINYEKIEIIEKLLKTNDQSFIIISPDKSVSQAISKVLDTYQDDNKTIDIQSRNYGHRLRLGQKVIYWINTQIIETLDSFDLYSYHLIIDQIDDRILQELIQIHQLDDIQSITILDEEMGNKLQELLNGKVNIISS